MNVSWTLPAIVVCAVGLCAPVPAVEPARAAVSTATSNVHVLTPLAMPGLDRRRTIRVYLPPGYAASHARYPVLYMHDGQNLFDAATSYAGEWNVDETLNRLARTRGLKLIVVGIDNGLDKRVTELNPWDSDEHGKGEGRQYMEFLIHVVKPYIDAHYRTRPDRAHTAIMGSSLGGLISHFAICQYPRVFSKAGIFSPAYWYAPAVFEYAASCRLPADTRIYFYAGGSENEHMVPDMQRAVALVRKSGLPANNVETRVDPAAAHNEAAWRAEFPRAVAWLCGVSP